MKIASEDGSRGKKVRVCITIDVEADSAESPNSTFFGITIIIPQLIRLFAKHNIKATFFLQEDEIFQAASRFSKYWKSLEIQGHEIGHHAHGLIRASNAEKEIIITRGIGRLNELGFHPVSFRAGRFHFDSAMLRILEKNNIKYDSSVVPGLKETFRDGSVRCDHLGAPHEPYFPSQANHCRKANSGILELPVNRYPQFASDKWGGTLTGGNKNDEILFDYFREIRKDALIIIAFHSWDGLSWLIKKVVRNEKNGKTKRYFLDLARRIAKSKFFMDGGYPERLDDFFRYVSGKDNIQFATIRSAGAEILGSP